MRILRLFRTAVCQLGSVPETWSSLQPRARLMPISMVLATGERESDVPIRPKRPRTEPKIYHLVSLCPGRIKRSTKRTSTMRILTKSWGSAASANAAVEPVMPTLTPQRRLQRPTVSPPQNSENPGAWSVAAPLRRASRRSDMTHQCSSC